MTEPHDIACARIASNAIARGEPNPFTETIVPGQDVTEMMGLVRRKRMYIPWCACDPCTVKRVLHVMHRHACCWLWKLALVVPLLHILLHLLGIPHPEVLSFIP